MPVGKLGLLGMAVRGRLGGQGDGVASHLGKLQGSSHPICYAVLLESGWGGGESPVKVFPPLPMEENNMK